MTSRSEPGTVSSPHMDSAVLAILQEVMAAEYPVLLSTFLDDSEERVRLLHAAFQAGEAEGLRLAAHSFKGSCSNMGAVLLADLCCELENMARGENIADAANLLESIDREFAIVRILYKAERQRFSGPL